MSDELPDEAGESDIRRRAAWLLGMLAIVAALFVALMVTFLGKSGDDKHVADVDPSATSTTSTDPSNPGTSASLSGRPSDSTASGAPSTSAGTSTGTSTHHGPASCPTDTACVLDGDFGNAVAAINAYRVKNGQKAVSGSVSKAAQNCALSNGSKCTGGWAESQVPQATGDAVISKIAQLGKLTAQMKSFEVGWAFDPGSKQYYFAIIRDN